MFSGTEYLNSLKLNGVENTLPNGIQYINVDAFKQCFAIPKILISSSLIAIGENAFAEWGTRLNQEQEIVIDKYDISVKERGYCGSAVITVHSILIEYNTNSPNTLEAGRINRFGNEQEFPIPTKEGYKFAGWYDEQGNDSYNDACGSGNQISNATGNLVPANLEGYKDTTFYAKWQIETYKIKWEFNGESPVGTFPAEYNAKSNFIIPNVSLSGYTFVVGIIILKDRGLFFHP